MRRTTTIVIGAGQSGLAMSKHLSDRGIDHVVLERGEVAHSWRTERWNSLRLLTPNWQSRLPGFGYEGDDPDGYRTMPETVAFIERYAQAIAAPVRTHTAVISVRRSEDGYAIATSQGEWRSDVVVLATGACNIASAKPGNNTERLIRQARRCTPFLKLSSMCSQVRSVNARMLIVVVLSVELGKTLASHT